MWIMRGLHVTHRGSLTPGHQDGGVEALGQVKHQQILPVLERASATDVALMYRK